MQRLLERGIPQKGRTRSGGQGMAGHKLDVVRSNSYDIEKFSSTDIQQTLVQGNTKP